MIEPKNPGSQPAIREVTGPGQSERFEIDLPFDLTGAVVQPDICAACAGDLAVSPQLPRLGIKKTRLGFSIPRPSFLLFPLCFRCSSNYWLRLLCVPLGLIAICLGRHVLTGQDLNPPLLVATTAVILAVLSLTFGPLARKRRHGAQVARSVRLRLSFSHLHAAFQNRLFAQRFCDLNGLSADLAEIEQEPLQLHLPHAPVTIERPSIEPRPLPPIRPELPGAPFEEWAPYQTTGDQNSTGFGLLTGMAYGVAMVGTLAGMALVSSLVDDTSSAFRLGFMVIIFGGIFIAVLGAGLFYPSMNARSTELDRRKKSSWRDIKLPPSEPH